MCVRSASVESDSKVSEKPTYEDDYALPPAESVYNEYVEMVSQFGTVLLSSFVSHHFLLPCSGFDLYALVFTACEYCMCVCQGYIVQFGWCWPLAAVCCLLNNVVEIRCWLKRS